LFDRIEHYSDEQLLWRENQWLGRVRPPLNVRKNWWGTAASWDEKITWMELFGNHDLCRLWDIANRPLGFVENWRGHVGIRYYLCSETWQVHVQTPGSYRNHYWLRGDGGSCLQINDWCWRRAFGRQYFVGDYHFMRLDSAIKARDEFREKHLRGCSPFWQQFV